MPAISLFPTRAAIGQAVMPDGTPLDVMMTPEFARALAAVYQRIGGDNGVDLADLTSLVAGIHVLDGFQDDGAARLAAILADLESLRDLMAATSDPMPAISAVLADIDVLRQQEVMAANPMPAISALLGDLDTLRQQMTLAPDITALVSSIKSGMDDLVRMTAADPNSVAMVALISSRLDDLYSHFMSTPDSGAAMAKLASQLEDLTRTVAMAPDGMARTAEIVKDLARRPYILAQVGTPTSVTGTLAATVLATVVVPANALGKNGMIRVKTIWSTTNSAYNKTSIIRFGGTDTSANVTTTTSTYKDEQTIQNRNATNSQVFIFGGAAYTGSPIGTMAKDTTVNQNIDIVGQLAVATETMTLEAYTVEVIPSPN